MLSQPLIQINHKPKFASPCFADYLQRESALEIGRRSEAGVLAYPVLALLLVSSTRVGGDHFIWSAVVVVALFIAALARFYLSRNFKARYLIDGERIMQAFVIAMYVQCSIFGIAVAAIVYLYGASLVSLLALMFAAAIASSGGSSLAMRKNVHLIFLAGLVVPGFISVFFVPAPMEYKMGLALFAFLAFLIRDGRIAHASYSSLLASQLQQKIDHVELKRQISERSQVESALQSSEKKLADLLEQLPDPVAIHSAGRIRYFNQATMALLGYESHELMNKRILEIIFADDHSLFNQRQGFLQQQSQPGPQNMRALTKRGEIKYLEVHAYNTVYEGKKAAIVIVRDLAARRAQEKALRESEFRYRNIFENTSELIEALDVNGNILYSNTAWKVALNYTKEEMSGLSVRETIAPDKVEQYLLNVQRVFSGDVLPTFETQLLSKDGTIIYVEGASTLNEENGRPVAAVAVFRDISERKRVEKIAAEYNETLEHQVELRTRDLSRREDDIRLLLDSTTDAIYGIDLQGTCTFCNLACIRLLGYHNESELLGKNMHDLLHLNVLGQQDISERECSTCLALRRGASINLDEEVIWRVDRSSFPAQYRTYPISREGELVGSMITFADISQLKEQEKQRKKLERQLLQSQKMEAIGQLAGGVAHDFNNILTGILGYTELALSECGPDGKLQNYLREIDSASDKASALVRQLLSSTRLGVEEMSNVDVAEIVGDVLSLLKSTSPSYINFVFEQNAPVGELLADPSQLHQIFLNLCTNSIWAIGDAPGELKLTLESANISPAMQRSHFPLQAGTHIKLSVSDNGVGMSADLLQRIYEPYFTTKGIGEGTGMGLSIVYSLVKNLNGRVEVESQEGKGTIFTVYLRCHDVAVVNKLPVNLSLVPGSAQILLIDDEESNVRLLKLNLERLGFTVVGESDPHLALKIFRADAENFDIVITDYTMPGMTGKVLAKEIQNIKVGQPVIMFSGFSPELSEDEVKQGGIYTVLTKPVRMELLTTTIHNALLQKEPSLSEV